LMVASVGQVLGGAIVEREINLNLNSRARVYMNLHSPDFTTAFRLAKLINQSRGQSKSVYVRAQVGGSVVFVSRSRGQSKSVYVRAQVGGSVVFVSRSRGQSKSVYVCKNVVCYARECGELAPFQDGVQIRPRWCELWLVVGGWGKPRFQLSCQG
jgi:hypothetical protein